MAEKLKRKSSRRSRLARVFLRGAHGRTGGSVRLGLREVLIGVASTLVITFLLVGFQFQRIPDYKIGDIADRTLEAFHDFTVEDKEATLENQEKMRRRVPAMFNLDLGVNHRVETEFRGAFNEARELISEAKAGADVTHVVQLPRRARRELLEHLKQILPRFDQGDTLSICLKYSFSPLLENKLVKLIQGAMKPPGVVLTRDALLLQQDRGIILRNTVTGQDEALNDWIAIRDLTQARDVLRQNEYELTLITGEEKRQIITFLDSWIVPNVHYNQRETQALERLVLQEVDPVLIHIKKGRILVRMGDEIEAREMTVLERLERLKQPRLVVGRFIGILLIVGFFLSVVWYYFFAYQKRHKDIHSHYLLVALVLFLTLLVNKIFFLFADVVAGSVNVESFQNPLNFYFLAPLASGAILLIILMDVEVSILYSVIFAVFVGLMTGDLVMFVYGLTSSLTAIHLMNRYRERVAMIKGGLILGAVNVVTILSLKLYVSEVPFQWASLAVCGLGGSLSGLISAMLAFSLLPILESLFRITTDIRLIELSNLNNPILRRLAVEAPGTYHHSIILGTLAESAAEVIDANPLLVRVGAYYHDIGKLKKPEYYVENQIFTSNKHENLSPSMSSLILVNHVKDGLAMAEEIKLSPRVLDLIPQHHGTRLMTYFYQKAIGVADGKERKVVESDFRYPGPKPQSKEAAILMLADQVEAAARTLQDPNPGQIRSMIRRLIQSTIQDRQFDECDITMKELDQILGVFERVITGMHHHRIEYPGFEFNKQVEKDRPQSQRIQ